VTTITIDQAAVDIAGALAQLQQSASVVAGMQRSTNRAFYGHLAEVYVWWRAASAVDGYLDAELVKLGKKFKRKVNYGINFAPVFWLVWGRYNGLDDDKARRYSIVLNRFHELYEQQRQYHTDTVPKLQNYLQAAGGVEGIVKDGLADDDDSGDDDGIGDDEADAVELKRAVDIVGAVDDLYGLARSFYGNVSAPPTLNLGATLPATDGGLSVMVVNTRADAYQLVGASNDESIIRPLLVHLYLQDFAALPPSVRCLAELVSTQCLPARLQPMYDALVDTSSTVRSRKAVRRVLYRHDLGDFVLSPIRATSGVVTMASPAQMALEARAGCECDAILSTRARRALERRLVSGKDFNLFEANRGDVIPAVPVGPASHVLRLQNRYAPQDFLFLDFWPYKNEAVVPGEQLAIAAGAEGGAVWHAELSLAWFRAFALEFTLPWIQTHGKYIKRSQQQVMSLRFARTDLTLQFVHRDGTFENEHTVDVPSSAQSGSAVTVCVLTKDFIVAMQAVADLGVVTPISFGVGDEAIFLGFATSAATYKMAIPTCSLAGVRNEGAFEQTSVTALAEEPGEDFSDQAEGDVQE